MKNEQSTTLAREYRELYSKLASNYDKLAPVLRLVGARVNHYRRHAVDQLRLKPGGSVLDLGCGTGISFPFLVEAVGASGRIVGIDITPAMLAQARRKIDRYGWLNVELIEANVNGWEPGESFDGVLCCHALCVMPEYREVIAKAVGMLKPGGRLVVMDVYDKHTKSLPFKIMATLLKGAYHPVEDAQAGLSRRSYVEMEKHLRNVEVRPIYGGAFYIAAGSKPV